jgi:hypothetical protein
VSSSRSPPARHSRCTSRTGRSPTSR